jgi:DNA-binding transcriptional LysR family regulator
MDLTALRIFQAVVEHGGVYPAAERLHRVPSNITTRVKQLEEELGIKLFIREGRKLALSDEGRVLLPFANQMLRLSDEAVAAMKTGKPRGVLRIGALESTSAARLPPLLSAYHALYPEVQLEMVTGTSGTLVDLLAKQMIEAAFVAEPFKDAGFESVVAFEEELVLIAPKGFKRIRTPADVGQRTIISFATGCSYRRRLESWLGAGSVHAGRIIEFQSYHAIIACVSAGTGIAIVPKSVLALVADPTAVSRYPLPAPIALAKTRLVWRPRYQSVALEAFKSLFPAKPVKRAA